MFTEVDQISFVFDTPDGWLEFIQSRPEATIFHHPAWIDLICQSYRYEACYIVAKDNTGKIFAGIPLVKIIHPLLPVKLISLPFTDHCIPLYKDAEILNRMVSFLVQMREEYHARVVQLRWGYPENPQINSTIQHVLSLVKLDPDLDLVARRIKRKHFRQIQVAEQRGVHVELGNRFDQLREFYRLHAENRKRHGLPVQPWRFFHNLHENLLRPDLGFIITAYQGKDCVAAGLFLAWNKTLLYKYSATNEMGRHSLATDLVLWQAIKWGCDHKYEVFDMGRSNLQDVGLRNFKSRWGANETLLSYSSLPFQPLNSESKPKKSQNPIFTIMNKTLQHSPVWVCRLAGELFYQYLT